MLVSFTAVRRLPARTGTSRLASAHATNRHGQPPADLAATWHRRSPQEAEDEDEGFLDPGHLRGRQQSQTPAEPRFGDGVQVRAVYERLVVLVEAGIRSDRDVGRRWSLGAGDDRDRDGGQALGEAIDGEDDDRMRSDRLRQCAALDLAAQGRTGHHQSV